MIIFKLKGHSVITLYILKYTLSEVEILIYFTSFSCANVVQNFTVVVNVRNNITKLPSPLTFFYADNKAL